MFRSIIVTSISLALISSSLILLWIFKRIAYIPATSARYAHFFMNLILLESAIAVAAFAVFFEVIHSQHNILAQVRIIKFLPLITIIVCGVVFLISLFGFQGLVQKNRCFLILYSILLFVVAAIGIAVGIYAFLTIKALASNVLQEMNEKLSGYNEDAVTKNWWDNLQHDFQCCGVRQASDWSRHVTKGRSLPTSCCVLDSPPTRNKSASCTVFKANKIGCYQRFAPSIHFRTLSSASVAIVFGIFQMLCSIVSYFLTSALFRKPPIYAAQLDRQRNAALDEVAIET